MGVEIVSYELIHLNVLMLIHQLIHMYRSLTMISWLRQSNAEIKILRASVQWDRNVDHMKMDVEERMTPIIWS